MLDFIKDIYNKASSFVKGLCKKAYQTVKKAVDFVLFESNFVTSSLCSLATLGLGGLAVNFLPVTWLAVITVVIGGVLYIGYLECKSNSVEKKTSKKQTKKKPATQTA